MAGIRTSADGQARLAPAAGGAYRRIMPAERVDTLIVGAGQAGLGVSHALAAAGVDQLVLEQGGIGESWRRLRWDSFRLNTPARLNRLPGGPDPVEPDAFPTASEFIVALERQAFRHRLPVRAGVRVRSVTPDPLSGRFRVQTDEGLIVARSVVAASGAARIPRLPPIADHLPADLHQLHTAHYRRPTALPPGGVLVVGGGQSGLQVAEDLLDAGRRVFVATSRVGRFPRRHRGRDVLAWLSEDGYFDAPRPVGRPPRQPQISGVGGGHTISYQALERRGAMLLGRLRDVNGHRLRFDDDLAANAAFADETSAEIRRRIDTYIAGLGIAIGPGEPDPADEPYAPAALPTGPAELDVRAAGISTVIWATGLRADVRWLPAEALDARGEIAHWEGATPIPGLFVVGQPWLRSRRSAMIAGAAHDGPHVAGLVADHLGAPLRAVA